MRVQPYDRIKVGYSNYTVNAQLHEHKLPRDENYLSKWLLFTFYAWRSVCVYVCVCVCECISSVIQSIHRNSI